MSDAINPDHYNQGSIECIEAMKIVLTPEEFRGYLKGNVFKYLWREKDKNGNEDLRKGKSYYDWLIELIDESEQQEASDLQSLKDHPFGKLKEPAWTPQIGDWVRIRKPSEAERDGCKWLRKMDKYDGLTLQYCKRFQFDGSAIVYEGFAFPFDWLEPAEQPKAHLNSDNIPEGYRKLNDSSEEPRQLGDLRWSVAEKRYIEISGDEIGYANRDNWAACRKVESVVKQSLNTEPDPGEGYQLLSKDTTEDLQPGDEWWHYSEQKWRDVFPTCTTVPCSNTWYRRKVRSLQNQTEPPDGWRFLEEGEVIRDGDKPIFPGGKIKELEPAAIGKKHERPCRAYCHYIRRNRFEVGEKVVDCRTGLVRTVQGTDRQYSIVFLLGFPNGIESKHLAPYIEDAK